MMRRLLLTIFLFILLGIVVALVFRHHQGYILLAYDGWQVETSLLFACAAILAAIFVVTMLWRLIVTVILTPRAVRRRLAYRRARKARYSLYRGLQRLAEGRWADAEVELRRRVEHNEVPGLSYLHAARAAQHQGHVAARDHYLEAAANHRGVSELAVLLTRAELQAAQGQAPQAMATLARLYQMQPRHPLVLQLYAEQAMASRDYKQLRALLPELQKHSGLSAEKVETYAIAAWYDALLHNSQDATALTMAWQRVPKSLRAHPDMVKRYAKCLRRVNADEQAAEVIRGVLKRRWSAPLVLLFGDLRTADQTAQLATVEGWLEQHGEKPELLLVAGRLCLRNRLWGRARRYFEASQKNQSRPEALLELGRLLEEINEKEQARAAYRDGLELGSQPDKAGV
jgi:HemY protein